MRKILKTFVFISLIPFWGQVSFADEASPWVEGDFSKARLIATHKAVPDDPQDLYLGLQIKMEEGWKTYWRSPGDAGQPPVLNWEGSVNLGRAEVLFPMPIRFELFNLQTYGYPTEVVYPIKIAPAVDKAPIEIKATVNYLVCKDLCVPVTANLSLTLPAAGGEAPLSIHSGLINKTLEKVPLREGEKVEISEMKLLGPPGIQNLVVRLKGENLMTGADIILEDLESFKFGIPKRRILSAANEAEFIIPVSAYGEEKDLTGKRVLVTLSDGWGNLDEREIVLQENGEN